ncbi:hypothetical protein C1646_695018 [Rhizophagus diaphanus]|nr:hypothetical protein C1646_695018 [Rhizophagus diaphanus] [Rhizophagus sp. MUCL 43196]
MILMINDHLINLEFNASNLIIGYQKIYLILISSCSYFVSIYNFFLRRFSRIHNNLTF